MKYSLNRQFEKNKELKSDNFVLVYQMGKVGSSSIEHTLSDYNIPSYHIHTFDDHEEFQMYHNRQDVKKFFDFKNRTMYRVILNHRKRLLQNRNHLKIVTLVRDPIATVLSRFFQDLHIQFIEGKKNDAIHRDMERTYQHLEFCFDHYINLNYFANWFDNELNKNFGIDVIKSDIDNKEQFYLFKNKKTEVMLIKCEHLNKLDSDIAKFLNVDGFILKNSNEAKNKWYSNIYSHFKNNYDFSKLFYMYDLPLYRHLYSEEERAQFKNKWLKTPGTSQK